MLQHFAQANKQAQHYSSYRAPGPGGACAQPADMAVGGTLKAGIQSV